MIVFVTGIGTDVGKTFATGAMARYLVDRGAKVITQKLVQTGNVGFSEDLILHRKMMKCSGYPEDDLGLTAPQIFSYPASPHLAAEMDGVAVDVAKITDAVQELDSRYDFVIVEGAGGAAVPLTMDLLTIDLVAEASWPCVVVSGGFLGSINQTYMTLEMLANRDLVLKAMIYNEATPADEMLTNDAKRMMLRGMNRYGYDENLILLPRIDDLDNFTPPDFKTIFGV